jgi:hypothetical protein
MKKVEFYRASLNTSGKVQPFLLLRNSKFSKAETGQTPAQYKKVSL